MYNTLFLKLITIKYFISQYQNNKIRTVYIEIIEFLFNFIFLFNQNPNDFLYKS